MIYLLLIIAVVLIILGWRLIQKEKLRNKDYFKEVLTHKQGDNQEYIKLQSLIYDLKNQIASIEEKLDGNIIADEDIAEAVISEDASFNNVEKVTLQEEQKDMASDYNMILDEVERMVKENKTVEEIAQDLNLGKGEVILLRNLLKK